MGGLGVGGSRIVDSAAVGQGENEARDTGHLGGKGNDDLGRPDWTNQRSANQFPGLNAGLTDAFDLFDGKRNSGDGGEDSDDGKQDGKNRLYGNTPKLVIVQFCLLGPLEGEELMQGKIIAVVFGATIDGNVFGNDVIGNRNHGFLADRAGD